MASFAARDIEDAITNSDDAFGKRIADGTLNKIDIASHYQFSPERVRLFKNDTRQFTQYNSITEFSDDADVWTLSPSGGDTMRVESAESVTYVVNYVVQASFAFEINQSLQSGDVLRLGPYNGTDGWVLEQRGADHADDEADIIESRNGSETTLETDVQLPRPVADWGRLECRYNWYNVGNQEWTITYTNDGKQFNETITETSKDGDRGPEQGNLPLWQEIQADSGTSNLELRVGSMGMIALGTPAELTRDKPQFNQVTVSGSANTWEPVYAIRIDPNQSEVNAQLVQLDILDYGANATIELVAASFDPSKTDISDSDWSVPDYHHATNSALQETTAVTQVPDSSGTQKDLGSSDKFGGYTIASAVDVDGGKADGTQGTANDTREEKKAILGSDHLVFLARSGTVDNTLSFVWSADQDW